jgi:murein L,D-transpeptidase YafK
VGSRNVLAASCLSGGTRKQVCVGVQEVQRTMKSVRGILLIAAALLLLLLALLAVIRWSEGKGAIASDRPRETGSGEHRLDLPLVRPRLVVMKHQRRLVLYSADRIVRTYRIALGRNPKGDKVRQGDGRTPEGDCYVCTKIRRSRYHRSLGLIYPNEEDAARGLRDGLIAQKQHDEIVRAIRKRRKPPWNTALGGAIMIHGSGSAGDWTIGCIALDDAAARELYKAVPLGTPATILP